MNYFDENQKPVVRLATINVIEERDDMIQALYSFADNEEGLHQAQLQFLDLVNEYHIFASQSELDATLKDEYYSDIDDKIFISIIRNTEP